MKSWLVLGLNFIQTEWRCNNTLGTYRCALTSASPPAACSARRLYTHPDSPHKSLSHINYSICEAGMLFARSVQSAGLMQVIVSHHRKRVLLIIQQHWWINLLENHRAPMKPVTPILSVVCRFSTLQYSLDINCTNVIKHQVIFKHATCKHNEIMTVSKLDFYILTRGTSWDRTLQENKALQSLKCQLILCFCAAYFQTHFPQTS